MNRNPRRGIHAPNTQNSRAVTPFEYEALGLLNPGSISVLDYQLTNDPAFRDWLEKRTQDGLEVYVRLLTGPDDSPDSVGHRLADLMAAYPWVYAFLPANEQNIEGWADGPAIDQWNEDVFWTTRYYGGDTSKLFYPPLAQDGADWGALERSIRTYVSGGAGFAWHSYWYAGDYSTLVENAFPQWLKKLLREQHVRTLIHEAGRGADQPHEGVGDEIVHRFGSARSGYPGTSMARAVTPWLLASRDEVFRNEAFVSESGDVSYEFYVYAWFGA